MEDVLLMPMEVPSAPKVRTTIYENFRGVDFTNDSTNIWHRRSPTGTNMLPDASGRPFKRHGWEILLSQSDICTALGVSSCQINKCSYFELAGVDHIVVFTDEGVLFYNGDESATTYTTAGVTAVSTDADCIASYDRCFFFEGGGTSAFYIYGNYKMWRYGADFTLQNITEELYIPRVVISAGADCIGTTLEPYNLLYNMASVEYNSNDLFACWGTTGLVFEVNQTTFQTNHAKNFSMTYTYKEVNGTTGWYDVNDSSAAFATDGITVSSTPKVGDQITVINVYGLLLPNNVDVNNQKDLVKVYYAKVTQWDTEVKVVTTTPSSGECRLHADGVNRETRQSWIEFNASDSYPLDTEAKDVFKTVFPSTEIAVTSISYTEDGTETAQLVGGDA